VSAVTVRRASRRPLNATGRMRGIGCWARRAALNRRIDRELYDVERAWSCRPTRGRPCADSDASKRSSIVVCEASCAVVFARAASPPRDRVLRALS
jgi:hypothetical protein